MIVIAKPSDLKNLKDGNKIQGSTPELNNSTIQFNGKNNILYCEKGVKLKGTTINFNGNNSLVYLSSNKYNYLLNIFINNDQVFYMGRDSYINDKLNIFLSEQKNIYIGSYCLFSTEIVLRNADPHLIYDGDTKKRINPTKSIFIGDHVWVGQRAMILKGTQIDSGSIIGAMSVVSGKKIPHNTSWAGNPIRQIKDNIFWSSEAVHPWVQWHTNLSLNWEDYKANRKITNDWMYHYDPKYSISFDDMDKQISACISSKDKLNYILNFDETHNKYTHFPE